MYGALAYSKFFGSPSYSGFVLENIIAQLNGPFFHDAFQIDPPTYFLFHMYAEEKKNITIQSF